MSDPGREPSQPPPREGSAFSGAAEILDAFEFEDPCGDEPRLGFKPEGVPEP